MDYIVYGLHLGVKFERNCKQLRFIQINLSLVKNFPDFALILLYVKTLSFAGFCITINEELIS